MKKILAGKSSGPSAKLIRDAINRKTGVRYLVTHDPEKCLKDGVLFRYGNSSGNFKDKDSKFNSPEFIKFASNKINLRDIKNDLYIIPEFKRDGEPEKYPCIFRSTLTGWGGKGIYLVNNKQELDEKKREFPRGYFTEYVKTEFELRVHIHDGKIVKLFRKEEPENFQGFIRNQENGFHFHEKNPARYNKILIILNELNKNPLFKDQFYGLDLGWCKEKQKYMIFEFNSAPGLNENTAELYADYLIKALNLKLLKEDFEEVIEDDEIEEIEEEVEKEEIKVPVKPVVPKAPIKNPVQRAEQQRNGNKLPEDFF